MRTRDVLALGAVVVIVPAVISIGGIALSFVPLVRDGIQPMILFMSAADGLKGVFFFTFFFGAPAAAVIGILVYLLAVRPLRTRPHSLSWALILPGLLGAMLLPPVWSIQPSPRFLAAYAGPAVLGALAGVSAGWAFWLIALRGPGRVAAAPAA